MIKELFSVTNRLVKKYGFRRAAKFGFSIIFSYIYYKKFQTTKTFTFQGKKYFYFNNLYNGTHTSERTVEIPIIWHIVQENKNKSILEIGNVLSKYHPFKHDIVDKYEVGDNVINQDVVDFKPNVKFDLIISISTLEHVGYDEEPRNPMKILDAFSNLKRLLAPNGRIVVTLPLGYNLEMDKLIKEKTIQFNSQYYMKRISSANDWKEINQKEVEFAKFEESLPPHANELIVGIIVQNNEKTL